jgi:membrane-associated phospholipid phosphatase
MDSATHPPGTQTADSSARVAEAKKRQRQILRISAFTLWVIGMIALLGASVVVHFFHPGPWPFDLQTTETLQSLHYPPWLLAIIGSTSRFNDIVPAVIALALWFAGLLLVAWLFKRQGKPALPWFVIALFLVGGTAFADLVVNFLLVNLVRRPRPISPLIHIYHPEPVPSFPSGHAEHTVVYYGFLLYLSFTRPVRQWRYRWFLLPLQIFAALNILLIGYSRIEEGSHWLSDVLVGYLEGAVCLFLLIFLYRLTLKKLEQRRAKKLAEQPA